jgi:DtxR family Mn-dependent transcriptional regulator
MTGKGGALMAKAEALSASLEDYLEAIFHIVAKKQVARAKDICSRMNVSGASVTGALRLLSEKGLVNYAPYDVVTLTDEGKIAAEDVVRRHEALRDFFTKVLLINEDEAEEASCKMEHAVSPEILERLIQFAEYVEICPRGGAEWIEGFGYRCRHGIKIDDCARCVSQLLKDVRKAQKRTGPGKTGFATLRDLQPGSKATIVKIKGRGATKKRMTDMGVTRGSLVEVERVAPLGDPIEVKIRGYHLSIRKEDAVGIEVEPLDSTTR